ncbi:S9 family peptidase [bacterium]|nr:S9 family peptidase [bacterium]
MRVRHTLTFFALLLGLAAFSGCSPRGSADLIPLDVLFGNPTQIQARLSPDGSAMTYLAPRDGVLNIWIKRSEMEGDLALTNDTGSGIHYHMWMFDNKHVLYIQDRDGDENWRVYAINVKTGEIRDLIPREESDDHPIRSEVLAYSATHPSKVVIGMNRRDERVHDAWLLDTDTGELSLLAKGEVSNLRWIIDNNLDVRGWIRANPDGGRTMLLRWGSSGPFKEAITWEQEDELASGFVDFHSDNRTMYIRDSRDLNSAALYAYDTRTGDQTLLAANPMYDVAKVMLNPQTMEAQAVMYMEERMRWEAIDPSIEQDLERMRKAARGDFFTTSKTLDDNTWVIFYGVDNGSGVYYKYTRDTGKFEKMFLTYPDLEGQPLVEMKPIHYTASDGMELHGYLTLPEHVEAPMPLVLLVHGGPWTRDYWGFDSDAQWLANRGYACLQVNFRGSSGYGKDYLNAGDREWGGRIQQDLTDGVQWAIDQGIADPEKVAIYGASFGGYAALCGAAFTPDLYNCAISLVGPSSLVTLLSTIPPYWTSYQQTYDARTGRLPRYESGEKAGMPKAEADFTEQDREDYEFLISRSPLYSADQIKIPLLIGQGANDVRVKLQESEQIVKVLKKNGVEVDYMLFPDEGHGLNKLDNRLDFFHRADAFLAKHLGGRAE